MVANVWNDCYGDKDGNINAISDRGWGPLNRALLEHPDVKKTKKKTIDNINNKGTDNNNTYTKFDQTVRTSIDIQQNVFTGYAGELLMTLQTSTNRIVANERNIIDRRKAETTKRKENKYRELYVPKVTARTLVGMRMHDISAHGFRKAMETKNAAKNKKNIDSICDWYDDNMKKYKLGVAATAKYNKYMIVVQLRLKTATTEKEKKKVELEIRKEGILMFSDDYKALIQYKQLGNNEKHLKLPATLDKRINA